MRIQQTQQILKESRDARHSTAIHQQEKGLVTKLWERVTSLFSSKH